MPNTQTISGSCLCGQVKYKATAVPLFQAHCHCQDCRKNCGSQLFGENDAKADRIHIKVGTMDDASWFHPQCNVWASSRLPSTAINPDVKDFATMPTAPAKK